SKPSRPRASPTTVRYRSTRLAPRRKPLSGTLCRSERATERRAIRERRRFRSIPFATPNKSRPSRSTTRPSRPSCAQRPGDRPHWRPGGSPKADAGADEGEFEDPIFRQFLEIGDFEDGHAGFRQQIGMDHLPVLRIRRGSVFEGMIVRPDDDCPRLCEELRAFTIDARRVRQIGGAIWPQAHAARADKDDVAGAKLRALMLEASTQVLFANAVARLQDVDAEHSGDVEDDSARNDGWMLVGAGLAPGAAAEMLVGREAVEDTAAIAEVV